MSTKTASPELPIRTIKIGTCLSLSRRSQLGYRIGIDPENVLQLRLASNDGGGQFNTDWVPFSLIEKLLTECSVNKAMSSRVLQPVFAGRSSNSAPFAFATLLSEGLVVAAQEKDSGYKLGKIDQFNQAMSALAASGINLDAATDPTPDVSKRKRKEA